MVRVTITMKRGRAIIMKDENPAGYVLAGFC